MPKVKTDNAPAKGFRARTLVTAKLGLKLGAKAAKSALNIGKGNMDEDQAIALASELMEDIDGLKGLVMKFGQMASYLGTSFPPNAQRLLARLQSEASAMPFETVKPILEEELGGSIESIFDSFEEDAFAAASIGQVHRAELNGTKVAVKIQYPGIEEAIRSDLGTIGGVLLVALTGARQDGKALTQELRQRLLEECDYRNEARNQQHFASLFADHPRMVIPQVMADYSTARVLVTQLAEARNFYSFRDSASQQAKNEAGATIFEFCMRSIFRHGLFNADPHPGNYLFKDSGEVVFLDFGCVKQFSEELLKNWRGMVRAVLDDDIEALKVHGGGLGLARTKKFDWSAHMDLMNHVYKPFKSSEPFTYNHQHVRESYDHFFVKNKNRFAAAMPADMLFVNRLSFGMNSVLADLDATADWGAIFRRCVFDE